MIFRWDIMILLTMIFFHIVDDYRLQGVLASMKQRQWWKDNAPDHMYKCDYIMALIMHSFSWTFMIMLPITLGAMLCYFDKWSILPYVINMIIHAIVDDLKANKRKINLIVDQTIHLLQIFITWFLIVYIK